MIKRSGNRLIDALKIKRATYHLWTFGFSKLISSFGAQVYAFAISFYILQLTGSASNFAMNLIFSILPRALAAPYVGYIADTYSKKKVVIISQIATTLAIGGLLIFSINVGLSLPAIYLTTAVLSITSAFSGVTFSSSITGLVDEARIQKAMAINQMSISFAAIGSPAIGGLLYGTVTMQTFLIGYMVASICAVILESTMNFTLFKEPSGEIAERERVWENMKAGFQYLKREPMLMLFIWIALFVNFFFGAFQVGYSFVLIEKLKMISTHFGITEGALAVGMFSMAIYLSARKEVKFPLIVGKRGILLMGISMAAISIPLFFSFSYNLMFVYYIGIMFIFGLLSTLVNTPLQVLLQKKVDDQYKGRVFALLETLSIALMPLGMVIFGILYDLLPAQWILIGSSLLLIIYTLIMTRKSIMNKVHPAV